MSERTPQEVRDDLLARRRRLREEMGSSDRIERQHAKGRLTIRERIDRLLDEGSFMEVGTFARSERREVRDSTPGDGKIGGMGLGLFSRVAYAFRRDLFFLLPTERLQTPDSR